MRTYRPTCFAELTVPVMGEPSEKVRQGESGSVIRIPLRVRSAIIEYNDHNRADSAKLSVEWRDAGIDPRFLRDATVAVYMGDASALGMGIGGQPDGNLRFVGVMTRPARTMRDGGFSVDLEFLDYTTLFLEKKPFPTRGVPKLSMRLDEAWRLICDHTGPLNESTGKIDSSVEQLRDRLRLVGKNLTEFPVLGSAVAARFRGLGTVPVKPQTDAWAVWQQCVGMLGLVSYIRKDECIVTTATDYYTANNPPKLVWGENIADMTEVRNPKKFGGVGVASFNTLTGTTLEGNWPPVGDPSIRKRKLGAKQAKNLANVRSAEDRTWYSYYDVSDQKTLTDIARRIWEERSRQEVEGTLLTYEMRADRVDMGDPKEKEFDLLSLYAGDVVRIIFPDDANELLTSFPSVKERVEYLTARGYSRPTAELLARNVENFGGLTSDFFVKSVRIELSSSDSTGKFSVEISYCNRIKVDGSTDTDAS